MGFTDKELKRLKFLGDVAIGTAAFVNIKTDELNSLLSRLEAAEHFHSLVMLNFRSRMPKELVDAEKAWLASKGERDD